MASPAPKAIGTGAVAGSGGALDVDLVTPKGVVAHQATEALTAPGELGEFELLAGHVAMLVALKPGVLTIGEKTRSRYAVSTGYLRVDPTGRIEVLVEQALAAADIDVEAARVDLKEAETALAKWGDKPADGDYQNLRLKAGWAAARIAAASN